MTGKRSNQRRAREELKRRGPVGDERSWKNRVKHDLDASRKARAAKKQQKETCEIRRSRFFGKGLFARSVVETSPSPRSDASNGSISFSSPSTSSGDSGGDSSRMSFQTPLKEPVTCNTCDDHQFHQGLHRLGQSETVLLEDEEEPLYPSPPFTCSFSVMDPKIREIHKERREHDQAVGKSLDKINRSVETLMAIGVAMNVELSKHSEALENIKVSATKVTEQTQLNNTRAARFLRRRF